MLQACSTTSVYEKPTENQTNATATIEIKHFRTKAAEDIASCISQGLPLFCSDRICQFFLEWYSGRCFLCISVLRTICWEIKACNLNIILTREVRGVSDQVLNARAFDSTAAFISCWVVSGTRVTRSCVAYCCLLAESCSWDGLLDCADQNTLLWKTRQIHCRWKAWWYCGALQQMSERT